MTSTIQQRIFAFGLKRNEITSVPRYWLISGLLFCGAVVGHLVAYNSLMPMVAAIFYLLVGAFAVRLMGSCMYELRMYCTVFFTGFFMSGIAAVYANIFQDPLQLSSDPWNFFISSSESNNAYTLNELLSLSDGLLANLLWSYLYDVFYSIGFEKAMYIGILFNVLIVAMSGVFCIKIAKRMFPTDASRINRLILIFPCIGLFWIFSAIHLRDCFILLGITVLIYIWVEYLSSPRIVALVAVIVVSGIGALYLGILRREFIFVPFAMLLAAIISIIIVNHERGFRKITVYIIASFGIILLVAVVATESDTFLHYMRGGYEDYNRFSAETSDSSSLGNKFIVNAPFSIRLLLGSIYLFVFPIPLWSGFQLESVYHLFKSFNAIFFYFFTPLFLFSIWYQFRFRTVCTSATIFIMLISVGSTLAVAGTSLETRHFGVFLPASLLLAVSPPLHDISVQRAVKKLTYLFLTLIVVVHLMWIGLKFL